MATGAHHAATTTAGSAEFDALFIRETTLVNHHTYRFARRAASEGLVVIDDPESILKCTNKVFLAELLSRHKMPMPQDAGGAPRQRPTRSRRSSAFRAS